MLISEHISRILKMNTITLTAAAQDQLRKNVLTRKQNKPCVGIKIGVRTSGCSGLAYTLEFVDSDIPDSTVIAFDDFNIYIEPKALEILSGMTVDYVINKMESGFEFLNPNEDSRCGCGKSFKV